MQVNHTMPKKASEYKRGKPLVLLITTIVSMLIASLPVSIPTAAEWYHENKVNSLNYKKTHGLWETVDLPSEFKLNTIHASTLPTGKVLLVAGSGNNRSNFNKYHDTGTISVLKTALFDPATNQTKLVRTPSDLFCSGHAVMQSGNLLIAGGTSGYELLKGAVTKPAGAMIIHNEDPNDSARVLKNGTKFIGPTGKVYVSTQDVVVNPATKMDHGYGDVMIEHSSVKVFVEAASADKSFVTNKNEHYTIEGITDTESHNIYGQGGPMTLNKQDYRGDNKSYEFDPIKEEYVAVGKLNESRWYAGLPVLTNGEVLAVSGLDNVGIITESTERYDVAAKQWVLGPQRAFPTYPALFRTPNPDVLFFSGSIAGYGPANKGREPGFWNVKDNSFKAVGGLRDSNILETSASVALPPKQGTNDGSQSYRIMIAGGGGIAESPLSTARTDVIDTNDPTAHYTPGPDLPKPLRYLNLTVTPWDDVFATGGSTDYRAKGNSYSHKTFYINPTTNQLSELADENVGRTYHSGSLLLPDGRILVFGGDALFSDKDDTSPGIFEQRMEIFTPPQLFRGERPSITSPPSQEVSRGEELLYDSKNAAEIKTARLIPPSSATHVTNIEQRSVAAVVQNVNGKVKITLPGDENILPNGWYMLFVTNPEGTPSHATMIKVIQ